MASFAFRIPLDVLLDEHLSSDSKALYGILASLGRGYGSQALLSRHMSVRRTAITAARRELEARGLVTTIVAPRNAQRRRVRANRHTLHADGRYFVSFTAAERQAIVEACPRAAAKALLVAAFDRSCDRRGIRRASARDAGAALGIHFRAVARVREHLRELDLAQPCG